MRPQRVVFSAQTYGPTESQAIRSQRAAIMHAASSGSVEWVGDMSPERMSFSAARNTTVNQIINISGDAAIGHIDGIFWCDADVVLPADGISRLIQARQDFITGIVVQRGKPHWPLIANYDTKADVFHFLREWPAHVIGPIDACGFGCVYTSTALLMKMEPPWFRWTKFSEDFEFCLGAKRAGFQLWMDTGVMCGHLKEPAAATVEDFFALRDSGALDRYEQTTSSAA